MSLRHILLFLLLLPGCSATAAPCSDAASRAQWTAPRVVTAAGASLDMAGLEAVLQTRRVVHVGELHDRYDHHLNQLEIICRLARKAPLAVGLEFFHTGAQRALDAYVNDHGDLDRLLRESEWFDRWRYDPRLYAPILRFAREHRIPLVALNVPGELIRRVAQDGLDGLTAAQRAQLPASIFQGPPAYRERLRRLFDQHPHGNAQDFQKFFQAQLLWDEGMAQQAANYLLAHPDRQMVILAGEGHIAYRDPIPDRLTRRIPVSSVLVLQSHEQAPSREAWDFQLATVKRSLPPSGLLGVRMDTGEGTVRIEGFTQDSAARDAGLSRGDLITAIDDSPVKSFADVRLALWRKHPGEAVRVSVRRDGTRHSVMLALR